jgi:lipoprotein-anchoring transpeptidase ErfK/SrfK
MRLNWIGAIIIAVAMLALPGVTLGNAATVKTSAPRTTVLISINKINQKMTVSVNGERKYVWLVSTGGPGYSTPSGSYRPFRMEVDHFSEEWDDAPMPHSIFFTPEGHAIHGSFYTKRLGTRASHGCVRLAPDNATTLFSLVKKAGMQNTTVVVRGGFDWGFSELTPPQIKTPKWIKKAPAKIKGLFGG